MPQLEALIFDVDGTLAETEELHRLAFNESFAAAALPWSWDRSLYVRLLKVTGGKERIKHYNEQHDPATILDDKAISALHAEKTARYSSLVMGKRVVLRTGVKRLLDEAAASDVRLAIATTTSRPNIDALLQAALGSQPFEVIAAGDEVAAKKPAPDVYELALERLGLGPGSCIALEDSLNGLRSAQGAGLRCVITTSEFCDDAAFPGALTVVDSLGDAGRPATVLAGAPVPSGIIGLTELRAWVASES